MAVTDRTGHHIADGSADGRRWRALTRLVCAAFAMMSFASSAQGVTDPVQFGKGFFLIAEPTLRDPNFRETVVLITHHDATGTMGVIINRPTTTRLSHLLPDREDLEERAETLHLGGPVDRRVLLLLVRTRTAPGDAHHVFGHVYLTQSTEVLGEVLNGDDPTAAIRLFAGYAGWAPGQLADEIAAGGWRVVPADATVVFDRDAGVIWQEMIRRTSEHYI